MKINKKQATTIVENLEKRGLEFIAILQPIKIEGEVISEAVIPQDKNAKVGDTVIIEKKDKEVLIKKIVLNLRKDKEKEETETVGLEENDDEFYEEAERIIMQAGKASASFLQRSLKIGYARAARLLDMLEERGVVGPSRGLEPREVYSKIEKDSSTTYFREQKEETKEKSTTKKVSKVIGIIILTLLIIISWLYGFFGIIFYVLGFYASLYFLSLLFKTTAILDTIIGIGVFVLYIGGTILGLYLLYLVLGYMFQENFLIGLLLLIFGLPLAEMLFYAILMALGAPLFYFQNQLEEKFGE